MSEERRSPTIDDVAKLAGVSASTVSRVINRNITHIPVSDDAISRVEAAMKELHYVPRAAARNLAKQQTNTIGILFSGFQGDFYTPLLLGIGDTLDEAGYELLISISGDRGPQSKLPVSFHRPNAAGLMIVANALDEDGLAYAASYGPPAVLLYQSAPPNLNIPSITIENKTSSTTLLEHLICVHGRRQIGFLRGPDGVDDSYWREVGYRRALEKHGLPINPALIARGDFDRDVAQASVGEWLRRGVEFDAIFTGDDDAAVGAIRALREAGKRVPEDVAIVGFDDQRIASVLTPPLTTISSPTVDVGRTAAQQLLRLIRSEEVDPVTLLSTKLVVRSSCGCEL